MSSSRYSREYDKKILVIGLLRHGGENRML
jgi:hypothetical protein